MLLIEHRAWWPFLFDNLSQQPIQTRQPFRALAWRIDGTPDPIALLADDAPGMGLVTHVLVWEREPAPGEIPTAGLRPIAENSVAALFAVAREVSRSPLPALPPGR